MQKGNEAFYNVVPREVRENLNNYLNGKKFIGTEIKE